MSGWGSKRRAGGGEDRASVRQQTVDDASSSSSPSTLQPPKRPMSAYLFYVLAMRPIVKEENPEMSIIDISKKLGEMWKELPAERAQHYADLAQEAKMQYERELEAFKAAGGTLPPTPQ